MYDGSMPGSWITQSPILGPDGRPWQHSHHYEPGMDVPHVLTFGSTFSSALKTYFHGGQDDATRNDEESAVSMRRNPHLMRLLSERIASVVTLKWHLECDDERDPRQKAVTEAVTTCIKQTPRLKAMLRYLSEGIWYGKYGAELAYEWRTLLLSDPENPGQKKPTRAPVIARHIPVEGDKFGFFFDGSPYVRVHGTWANEIPQAQLINTTAGRGLHLTGTFRRKFIIHQHQMLDSPYLHGEMGASIHGVGLRHFCYWTWWLEAELLSYILDYAERQGCGVKVWYYQAGNKQSKDEVTRAAELSTNKTNIVVPRLMNQTGRSAESVEFVDSGSQGAMLLLQILKTFKDDMELLMIGQTLSSGTEGSGLGGSGVAAMHANTKHQLIELDADNLAETLTADWVRPVLGWMFPEWRDMPLRWVFEVDPPDVAARLQAVQTAYSIGVDFVKEEVRSLTGLSTPQEGDETISQAQQMQQQAAMNPQPVPGDGDGDGVPNEDGIEPDMSGLMADLGVAA